MVLPLQNGVLAVEELQDHINKKHIIGGLCRIISQIDSPGVINHLGINPTIVFGEQNHSVSKRVLKIKTLFDQSDINNNISESSEVELWKKFLFICSGGLLAITRSTYGELREIEDTRQMFLELFTEIYILAKEIGIDLPSEVAQKSVDFIDSHLFRVYKKSKRRNLKCSSPRLFFHWQYTLINKQVYRYFNTILISQFYYCSILIFNFGRISSPNITSH